MDTPLHPAVVETMRRADAFLGRVTSADCTIVDDRVSMLVPDGGGENIFNGDGMVVDIISSEDAFDRYRGEDVSDLLAATCKEGWHRLSWRAAVVAAARDMAEVWCR